MDLIEKTVIDFVMKINSKCTSWKHVAKKNLQKIHFLVLSSGQAFGGEASPNFELCNASLSLHFLQQFLLHVATIFLSPP